MQYCEAQLRGSITTIFGIFVLKFVIMMNVSSTRIALNAAYTAVSLCG